MLETKYKTIFGKDVKRAKKRGKDFTKLKLVMSLLIEEQSLPSKYKDHSLAGNYIKHRECHIEPDWLLIYKIEVNKIIFIRTGSHADLFE